jgi:hypothetical protein
MMRGFSPTQRMWSDATLGRGSLEAARASSPRRRGPSWRTARRTRPCGTSTIFCLCNEWSSLRRWAGTPVTDVLGVESQAREQPWRCPSASHASPADARPSGPSAAGDPVVDRGDRRIWKRLRRKHPTGRHKDSVAGRGVSDLSIEIAVLRVARDNPLSAAGLQCGYTDQRRVRLTGHQRHPDKRLGLKNERVCGIVAANAVLVQDGLHGRKRTAHTSWGARRAAARARRATDSIVACFPAGRRAISVASRR